MKCNECKKTDIIANPLSSLCYCISCRKITDIDYSDSEFADTASAECTSDGTVQPDTKQLYMSAQAFINQAFRAERQRKHQLVLDLFAQAKEITMTLRQREANDPFFTKMTLSIILNSVRVAQQMNNDEAVLNLYNEFRQIHLQAKDAYGNSILSPRKTADILKAAGICFRHANRHEESLVFFEEALQLHKKMENTEQPSEDNIIQIAILTDHIGCSLFNCNRIDDATAMYEESVKLCRYLFETFPKNEYNATNLAMSLLRLAEMPKYSGDEGIPILEESVGILTELLIAEPLVLKYLYNASKAYYDLGSRPQGEKYRREALAFAHKHPHLPFSPLILKWENKN